MFSRLLPRLFLALLAASACAAPRSELTPGAVDSVVAPDGVSSEAWTHAVAAHRQATLEGRTASPLVTIIDFTLPATRQRLWVVDLGTHEVLATEYVAHGKHSGGLMATRFSNRDGTHQSSLGTFITAAPYIGVRGISLRLRGLEPGINDNAWNRGIVIHGTPNVSASRARKGTMGRTEGCPAVPKESARRLIRLIENGVVVFAWFPDRAFLEHSEYLERGAAAIRLATLE
ncbi:MAG TPA: murein L,D-transpeptidase catalytic domain family protein [Gemmatimonadales bacterium]|nr:murein L,D-transpeptidase catalytic domain family protein [Gemmatimonadales bacterium]